MCYWWGCVRIQPNFMKPFSRKNLDSFIRICNYRFLRARRISENVFDIITNRWRVCRSQNSLLPEKVREFIRTVLTLHNWLRSVQSKTVYMLPGVCDICYLTTQSFIPPGGGKKIITIAWFNYPATWKQPISCCKENQGGV